MWTSDECGRSRIPGVHTRDVQKSHDPQSKEDQTAKVRNPPGSEDASAFVTSVVPPRIRVMKNIVMLWTIEVGAPGLRISIKGVLRRQVSNEAVMAESRGVRFDSAYHIGY